MWQEYKVVYACDSDSDNAVMMGHATWNITVPDYTHSFGLYAIGTRVLFLTVIITFLLKM